MHTKFCKISLRRPLKKWDANIKMDLRGMGSDSEDEWHNIANVVSSELILAGFRFSYLVNKSKVKPSL
jgi:hypothetical protein